MIINSLNHSTHTLRITPTHPSDIHILFQNLLPSHTITMPTTRKIEINDQKKRVSINLTIRVCNVTIDLENSLLIVRGQIAREIENVKMGSYHNMNIGLNDCFSLEVQGDLWRMVDRLVRDIVVFMVIVFRNGKYEVGVVDEYGVECKGAYKKKEFAKFMKDRCANGAQKSDRSDISQASRGKDRQKDAKHGTTPITNSYRVKYIVCNFDVASFVNTSIPSHTISISKEHEKLPLKALIENILSNLTNTSIPFVKDLMVANQFLKMYERADDLIALGIKDVLAAIEFSAIDTMIVTVGLYCTYDVEERHRIRKMVEMVGKDKKVVIISDGHACGNKLNYIGGIGAILKYNYKEEY
ncbi:Meiotic cell division protein Pelota/DOM34 [Trachipleistophora hominis]|uniref:Meiotic cell division protein Pelota/DOM34 n=1 Tax=Trachipleistophora hominis TaxID=72359 RepID=L7JW92_TRAHO|nr:Meiotic cell division protein Pelota/DOM34 [Trachipleistophora hominis]